MICKLFRKKRPNEGKEVQHIPFELPSVETVEGKIIHEAIKHLGLRETKKNWSKGIAELLSITHWRAPWPWCQFYQNAIGIRALGDKWLHGKGGGTQDTYYKATQRGLTSQTPVIGSQITWQNKSDHDHGHVGLVAGYKDEDHIYTIEGNAGNKSGIFVRSFKKGYYGKTIRGYILPEAK